MDIWTTAGAIAVCKPRSANLLPKITPDTSICPSVITIAHQRECDGKREGGRWYAEGRSG
jgi:hypothetical protein